MKVSLNWLKDHINLSETAEEIAEHLTTLGLEIEEVEAFSSLPNSLDGVVVGHVLETIQHPDADRLRVCTVDIGSDEPAQIVCGAPNIAAGQFVPVATIGTKLTFSDGKELKIKKGKIRGQLSEGMICAEDELGLGDDHDGIMVLAERAKPGSPFEDQIEIYRDHVFTIGLTPNRVDAANHRGVARDLAARFNRELAPLHINQVETSGEAPVKIEVLDQEACPRYSALLISGVKVTESPDWLKNKLQAVGLSPINNIVDITNYVMHDIGHPLHAFDRRNIPDDHIVVRRSEEGEKLVTLDEKERELDGSELLICNKTEPIALAGVFGGLGSGVKDDTTEIILESAYFHPSVIRAAAKRHQLSTDASFRYERGADPNACLIAARKAANLIHELAGGEIKVGINDFYPEVIHPVEIDLDVDFVQDMAGYSLESDKIISLIEGLGMEVISSNEASIKVCVPTNKPDVLRPVDLVEDIMRVVGYDEVPLSDDLRISLPSRKGHRKGRVLNEMKATLKGQSFTEIKSVPMNSVSDDSSVAILNPISQEMTHLRSSLLLSGLDALKHNLNRQQKNLAFFEHGFEYRIANDSYEEEEALCIWQTGNTPVRETWNKPSEPVTFFNVKRALYQVLSAVGVEKQEETRNTNSEQSSYALDGFHQGKLVYSIGEIKRSVLEDKGIDQAVFFATLKIEELFSLSKNGNVQYKDINPYPYVVRDLSFTMLKSIAFSEVEDAIYAMRNPIIRTVECFDRYEGEHVEEGQVSYAIRIRFEDEKKTLKDKQVDAILKNVISALEKLGCKIRM